MRLTVGPLPAHVYWRRRAIVLGGILLVVLLIVYACGGFDDNGPSRDDQGKPSPSGPVYPSDGQTESPDGGDASGSPGAPDGTASPAPGDGKGNGSGDGDGSGAAPGAGPGYGVGGTAPVCQDADLSIKPVPERTRTPEGARLRIDLVITNISDRPCQRDIGADQQEIRIMQGTQRIWSSDDCNPQRGELVETLAPHQPVERFWVTWDGRTSAPKCEGDRTVVQEGGYAVLARLGGLLSKPVALAVVDT